MDRALTEQDLLVRIGSGTCLLTSLSRTQITCRPPRESEINPTSDHAHEVVVGVIKLLAPRTSCGTPNPGLKIQSSLPYGPFCSSREVAPTAVLIRLPRFASLTGYVNRVAGGYPLSYVRRRSVCSCDWGKSGALWLN